MKTGQLTVLLVDDNQLYARRMMSLLSEVSEVGTVMVAPGFDEAQKVLDTETPDVVLLDINLGSKSGLDLLREIKSSDRSFPVIMVSNNADEFYRRQCKKLGADYFLDKTNEFSLVPDLIRTLSETNDILQKNQSVPDWNPENRD